MYSVTENQVFFSITQLATGKKNNVFFLLTWNIKQFLWLSGQL